MIGILGYYSTYNDVHFACMKIKLHITLHTLLCTIVTFVPKYQELILVWNLKSQYLLSDDADTAEKESMDHFSARPCALPSSS